MSRVLLIANPAAARTEETTVREVEQLLRAAGWQVELLVTGGHGDARRLADEGVAQGVDVVAVLGGDGTIMQAAAALVGTDVALGIIPGGTGNLLAGNLDLPTNPLRAAAVIAQGEPRAIDLGRLVNRHGTHYFAVAAGAGVDARVMTETSAEMKHKWGMMAYVATTLRILPYATMHPFRLTIDGVIHEAEAAMVLVANCGKVIPPIISLGDDVSPEDGLLDVVLVQAHSIPSGVRAVWDLLRDARGTFGEDVFVTRYRGTTIEVVVGDGPQPVQLDGDGGGDTPFTATVLPKALRVMRQRS